MELPSLSLHAGVSGLITAHPEIPCVVDYLAQGKNFKSGPEATSLSCEGVATLKLGSPCTSERNIIILHH